MGFLKGSGFKELVSGNIRSVEGVCWREYVVATTLAHGGQCSVLVIETMTGDCIDIPSYVGFM
jgi:hypothetical protein